MCLHELLVLVLEHLTQPPETELPQFLCCLVPIISPEISHSFDLPTHPSSIPPPPLLPSFSYSP